MGTVQLKDVAQLDNRAGDISCFVKLRAFQEMLFCPLLGRVAGGQKADKQDGGQKLQKTLGHR